MFPCIAGNQLGLEITDSYENFDVAILVHLSEILINALSIVSFLWRKLYQSIMN